MQPRPSTWFDKLEENLIALFLGLMTIITFANVVARYVFNDNILWALEATVYLFAWMVLLGASYCVKITAHLGVDTVVNLFAPPLRRTMTLLAVVACLAFSILILIGGWNYWWKFAGTASFMEVNDIPMPGFLQFLADWRNEGELYEKLPRFIPYFILPLSMALLVLRFLQAGWRVYTGQQDLIIVSHEVEDDVKAAAKTLEETSASRTGI
ncbi:MAG: C4-dicarboxylate ABC transporter permease [Minwuia thermotolerans]|nr:MAG: C4-dicarboxylate ABC transporter permease [Minwuia thermotolerans]